MNRIKEILKNLLSNLWNPRDCLLIGLFIGLIIPFPYFVWLEKTPRIVGEETSVAVYNETKTRTYVIENIPTSFFSLWSFKTINLTITTMPFDDVNKEFKKRWPKEKVKVWGFYSPSEHAIFCVPDVGTVIHEIRHVFKKFFHR